MPATRLLIISNGHGEDSIAAEIARRLPVSVSAEAYPTLGDGRAYENIIPIVGPRAHLPSEGWRNTKNSVARDVMGGGISTVWPGLRFIRAARGKYDRVMVVGDMMGVYGAWITGHRGIVYVDVYKTGFGSAYLGLDKWIMRTTARTVFCRSEKLARSLDEAGINARAAGNVMMDTIPRANGMTLPRRRGLALTILPGSRGHALDNFALQAKALALVPPEIRPDLFLAVAGSVDEAALRERAAGLEITYLPGRALGDMLATSDFVLSQAGTATIQAIGLGRPAITFRTAEDRPSRFRQESQLFGDGRLAVEAEPQAIAAAITTLATDPGERLRRAAVGRERIGPPGAIDAIIAELTR
jgi:hypothetical protein